MDDDVLLPEPLFPDVTNLPLEEFVTAMTASKEHQDMVKSRVGVSRDHF